MESLKQKKDYMHQALTTLDIAIESYTKIIKASNQAKEAMAFFPSQEEFERMARDSMIQRFEFCCDLFWKFLKDYLEIAVKIILPFKSPLAVFRALCQARYISEQEAEDALKMVECRNKTSHIYKEEIAEHISKKIPHYYALMSSVMQRIKI